MEQNLCFYEIPLRILTALWAEQLRESAEINFLRCLQVAKPVACKFHIIYAIFLTAYLWKAKIKSPSEFWVPKGFCILILNIFLTVQRVLQVPFVSACIYDFFDFQKQTFRKYFRQAEKQWRHSFCWNEKITKKSPFRRGVNSENLRDLGKVWLFFDDVALIRFLSQFFF